MQLTDNDLVNFVQCGDEIYATSETAILTKVDPKTLDTLERVLKMDSTSITFRSVIALENINQGHFQVDMHKYISTIVSTAHPHYDRQGNMYNIGSSYTTYNIIFSPNPLNAAVKGEKNNIYLGTFYLKP